MAARDSATAAATADYLRGRGELLAAAPSGATGRGQLVARTGRWLDSLFQASGAAATGAALVAAGSLGRGELAPGSDLDLMLLHPASASPAEVAGAADRMWYPLWDSGFPLDHSVRSPAQARRLAATDLRVVLGLIDARTIAGDDALLSGLRAAALADWRALAPRRLAELRESVRERAVRSGELAHLLEPDLKESYGGLRDLVALRAVAASWVTDAPVRSLAAPRALLLDVRDQLHRVTGRGSDQLRLQEQAAVAEGLGVGDADALLAAVAAAGRAVAVASEAVWHRVARQLRPAAPSQSRRVHHLRSRAADRAPLAGGVVEQAGEVVLAAGARPERDPVLVLRAAAAAAQAGLVLAPYAVDRLAAGAPMPEPWPTPARDALVSLLGAGRAAVPVWEALDQAGVWSRLLPGWAAVRSAPQHNPVHRFTVDRHLLEAAVRSAALVREVSRPDLLLVGALLHDIGKGRSGDHTEVGLQLVGDLAPRMGFEAADTATLVRLVEHHLLLPDTATRRDLDDPATVAAVAAAARTPDFLDLLHALTRADAAATGPAAWSGWKASLVAQLVARTRAALDLSAAQPPSSQPARVDPDVPAARLMAGGCGPVQVHWRASAALGTAEVVVASPDRSGLLATVAGVLALHRLQVRAAQVSTESTTVGPLAVQRWVVEPQYGEPSSATRLRADLQRALDGHLDLRARLRARDLASDDSAARPAPTVELVPGASDRATVLEVRAHDSPGLLHRVCTCLAAAGVAVRSARVSTLGSEVVDVFYLWGDDGDRLRPEREAAVREAVLAGLILTGTA